MSAIVLLVVCNALNLTQASAGGAHCGELHSLHRLLCALRYGLRPTQHSALRVAFDRAGFHKVRHKYRAEARHVQRNAESLLTVRLPPTPSSLDQLHHSGARRQIDRNVAPGARKPAHTIRRKDIDAHAIQRARHHRTARVG